MRNCILIFSTLLALSSCTDKQLSTFTANVPIYITYVHYCNKKFELCHLHNEMLRSNICMYQKSLFTQFLKKKRDDIVAS